MFSFAEICDMAIQIEKNGERIYLAAMDHANTPELKDLLAWMAKEESDHAQWFEALKQKSDSAPEDAVLAEMSEALIQDYLKGQAFSLKDVDFSVIENMDALIAIFVEFEQDTILFYDLLVAFVPDDAVKMEIQHIIKEEETHMEKLQSLINCTCP